MIIFDKGKINKIIKSVAFILIVSTFFSLAPIKVREVKAQWIVFNPTENLKEFVLDAILYKIIDLIIQRVTASTVNWINSGFRGSPAFVTNPENYFLRIADETSAEFIQRSPNLQMLCGPLQARIKIALAQNYTQRTQEWRCTMSDVYGNAEDFINDFERGGWQKFFRLTQEQQNNPLGAYIQAEGELARRIASKLNIKQQELSWGKGFLSFKTCQKQTSGPNSPTNNVDLPIGDPIITPDGQVQGQEVVSAGCIPGTEKISTPGSVIEDQLGDVLKIGNKKISVADEINEIINALLGQLVNKIIGGVGAGLRALSRPDSTNNNSSFTSQLYTPTNDGIIQGYVQTSQNNLQTELNRPENDRDFCRNNPTAYGCPPPPTSSNTSCNPATDPNCTAAPNVNPQVPSCPAGDFQCLFCRDNPTDPQCRQGVNSGGGSSSI